MDLDVPRIARSWYCRGLWPYRTSNTGCEAEPKRHGVTVQASEHSCILKSPSNSLTVS